MARKPKVYSPTGSSKTRRGTDSKNTSQPEFDTVEAIRQTVENMQLLENERARDRALIDVLANGERPYSPQEVEEYQVQFNINWGELSKPLRDANSQLNGALLFKPQLFTATCKGGPVESRDEYSQKFTSKINDAILLDELGSKARFLLKARNASVCAHGIGVTYWPNDYCPLPTFVPLENFLVPTDTLCDFSNCTYFDIKVELTPYELYERTHGDVVDENWNMDQVKAILDGLAEMKTLNANNYNWVQHPEKMQEIFKQNRCYLNSDSVAKVKLDYFYSKENTGKWFLKIVMREGIGEADTDEFVYINTTPFADTLLQILHIQYGDNSLIPPNKHHSVRGLGAQLYSPAWALNMFRSDLFQHGKEQMRMYLRLADPSAKGRENMVNLMQYGILEDGVSFVSQAERHQINVDLVDNIIAQCRQNATEQSSAYVSDIDNGTEKEQTLGETQIRQQTANMNVSNLLTMMYYQENSLYQEIVRRFLNKNSGEDCIKQFQKDCIQDGIPPELMVPDNWRIQPDRVLGSGDKSLALQQATSLYAARSGFDPKTQRMISRQFVSTLTEDPAKGMLYVPDTPDNATNGAKTASDFFGTLMQGGLVPFVQGITQTDYISTMLKSVQNVINQIQSSDNMGTAQQVAGLAAVLDDIKLHTQAVMTDPTQKMFVKQTMDAVGKMENELKGFAQRIQQQKQAGQSNVKDIINVNFSDLNPDSKNAFLQSIGLPPSTMTSPDPQTAAAVQKMQLNQAKFNQKTQQDAIRFQVEQIMKLTDHEAGMTQAEREHNQELAHAAAEKIQELYMASIQPAEPEPAGN
jgi:hypothetical protein